MDQEMPQLEYLLKDVNEIPISLNEDKYGWEETNDISWANQSMFALCEDQGQTSIGVKAFCQTAASNRMLTTENLILSILHCPIFASFAWANEDKVDHLIVHCPFVSFTQSAF